MSFVGFVQKYGGEAMSVADALAGLAARLPMLAPEAAAVHGAVDILKTASNSIAQGIADGTIKEPTVIISEADIDKAVARYFASNPPRSVPNA